MKSTMKTGTQKATKKTIKKTILIKGTHCPSCKAVIEDVCKEVDGVISCSVDFKTGKTTVEHDGTVKWKALKEEIESLGDYEVQISE